MPELSFCTAISRNYAPYASVLTDSLAEHHPGAPVLVLVADAGEEAGSPGEPANPAAEIVAPEQLGLPRRSLERMATASAVQQLVSRLKPLVLREAHRRYGRAVFLDADSCVYAEMPELDRLLAEHPVLLTPHIQSVAALPARSDLETGPLVWGIHNGGFAGAGRGAEPFLDWWWSRTSALVTPDHASPLSFSQIWTDHAVTCFGGHTLLRGRVNVSLFDLAGDDLEWRDDQPAFRDERLGHFHFLGGIVPSQPEAFTANAHQRAVFPDPADRPGARRLYAEYFERIRAAGADSAAEPLFDRAPGGREITLADRQVYRDGLYSYETLGTAEPPNPFGDGPDAFFGWLELIREQRGAR